MILKEIKVVKDRIRKEILAYRSQLSPESRTTASLQIIEKLVASDLYQHAKVIFAFVPFRHEVEIESLFEACWADQKEIYVPKVDPKQKSMQFYRIQEWEDLEQGHYGIREPKAVCHPYTSGRIDLILMPGAAFDRAKSRLGYGAGYYDRYLRQLEGRPFLLAPAFAMQIIEEVPTDEWDCPVDRIVTETEWIL